MARSLADDHTLCTQTSKALDRGSDKERVRVDVASGDVVDKVWFQKNSFSLHAELKQLQPRIQNGF